MAGSVYCRLNSNMAWLPAAHGTLPQSNTIYLWSGETAQLLSLYYQCYAILDATEKARVASYSQITDQQRYVIQHGLLRVLLGWYLDRSVFDEGLLYGEHGKPYLPGDTHSCHFSLSSSHDVFLIAIGDKEIGADIESIKPGFDYGDVAAQYFSKAEQDDISAAGKLEHAFLLLWTRKEALMKASGKGIDDNIANIPALNGEHALPANYGNTEWIIQSYITTETNVISVTFRKSETRIEARQIDAAWAMLCFS